MINSVKIFGERHTGTNVLRIFLKEHFNLYPHEYSYLGWKHRLAPQESEIEKFDITNTLFAFTFRSPYTWIQAMHREPYYPQCRDILHRPLEEFVTFQIEDYENSITMWNQKNRSYIELSKKLTNSLLVKVEDFRNFPSVTVEKLNLLLGTDKQNINRIDTYVNGQGMRKGDVDKNLNMKPLPQSTLELINKHLDFQVMNELGYNIEE